MGHGIKKILGSGNAHVFQEVERWCPNMYMKHWKHEDAISKTVFLCGRSYLCCYGLVWHGQGQRQIFSNGLTLRHHSWLAGCAQATRVCAGWSWWVLEAGKGEKCWCVVLHTRNNRWHLRVTAWKDMCCFPDQIELGVYYSYFWWSHEFAGNTLLFKNVKGWLFWKL